MTFEERYGKSFEGTPATFKDAFREVWDAAQEEYEQRVREAINKLFFNNIQWEELPEEYGKKLMEELGL